MIEQIALKAEAEVAGKSIWVGNFINIRPFWTIVLVILKEKVYVFYEAICVFSVDSVADVSAPAV